MRRLWRSRITSQKGFFSLFLIACTLIFTMTPLSISSLQKMQTEVESNITHYARGSYDILVRPLNRQHPLEESLGIVPENYLGVGDGGITMSQWDKLNNHPEIEIAAPVIALGYHTGIRTNIGISPIPEESTRYITQYSTSDGVNRYPIGDPYVGILMETPLTGQKFEALYNTDELMNEFRETAPMFPFPLAYHLVVGIDPEAESALTGINFDEIKVDSGAGGWGTLQWSDLHSNAPLLPIMQLKEGVVSLQANIKVDTLGFEIEDVQKYRDRLGLDDRLIPDEPQNHLFFNVSDTEPFHRLMEELTHYPEVKREEIDVDLKKHLHPFPEDYEALIVSTEEELAPMDPDGKYMATVDVRFSSTYYTADHVQYEKIGDQLKVKKIGEENGVPTYRNIEKKGLNVREVFDMRDAGDSEADIELMLDPVGEYTVAEKTNQLAASPLGIYQLEPAIYIGDGVEEPIPMQATVTPGSFVPAPATGVTNVEAAAAVKGEKPIDAIRVKVAGIDGYTPEAANKIEQIAEEIEAMGLHVSIVAGASHQLIDVEVEGVGHVQEAWTTLGAAGTIVSQWNITNILLAVTFLLVSFMYIYNRILFWHVQQRQDMMKLQLLGWDKRHILRLYTGEIGILIIISWFLALGGLYFIKIWFETSNFIYLWQIGFVLVAFLMFTFMMSKRIQKGNNSVRSLINQNKRPVTKSLIRKNIAYFRRYITSSFIQLLVVSALSLIVYLSVTKTVQQTNLTVLGEYINVQTSGWHFLLVISAYILALSTLTEGLTSLFVSRQREIGIFRSLGWKLFHIFKLYMKEVLLWTGIAIFIGHACSFLVYISFFDIQKEIWIITGVSFIGLYAITALVSAFILYRLLLKELGNTLALKRTQSKKKAS